MKLIFLFIILFIGSNTYSQDKDQLLLELKNLFTEHCKSIDKSNFKDYYNIEEKILDIGESIPLKLVTYKYIKHENKGVVVHTLEFKCQNGDNCITQGKYPDANGSGYIFDSKENVYKAIDIIYKLKQQE